jgi:hypothetical protein
LAIKILKMHIEDEEEEEEEEELLLVMCSIAK